MNRERFENISNFEGWDLTLVAYKKVSVYVIEKLASSSKSFPKNANKFFCHAGNTQIKVIDESSCRNKHIHFCSWQYDVKYCACVWKAQDKISKHLSILLGAHKLQTEMLYWLNIFTKYFIIKLLQNKRAKNLKLGILWNKFANW